MIDPFELKGQQPIRPFFIVGSPRSGTTLLRFMLSSHSKLYVPDETGFIPFLRCDPSRRLTLQQTDEVLKRIGQLNRFWKDMVNDVAAFHHALPEPRLPFLLDALYRQRGQLLSSDRWGDKTPLYVRYIPHLTAIFPQAQFIHVIRDGRDATLSAYEKWGRTTWYMDHYYLLRNWQRNIQDGLQAQQQLPADQFFILKYESLVTDTERTLHEISDFLAISFEPAMLEHTILAQQVGGGIDHHIEVQHPVHSQHLQRWQQEMTSFEKKMANQLIGATLQQLDYPMANEGSLKWQEWLKMNRLALKFFFTDTARNLLYQWGILTLNKNRR